MRDGEGEDEGEGERGVDGWQEQAAERESRREAEEYMAGTGVARVSVLWLTGWLAGLGGLAGWRWALQAVSIKSNRGRSEWSRGVVAAVAGVVVAEAVVF